MREGVSFLLHKKEKKKLRVMQRGHFAFVRDRL